MNQPRGRLATLISAGFACLLSLPAAAQYSTPSSAGIDGELPWYIGVGQGFFHDTNVYHTTDGPSDTYSSTTLFGGFDQQISRQRFHGKASVALNRYFDEKRLDNTSYNFALGLDWETVASLSGSLDGGVRQHLAYPSTGGYRRRSTQPGPDEVGRRARTLGRNVAAHARRHAALFGHRLFRRELCLAGVDRHLRQPGALLRRRRAAARRHRRPLRPHRDAEGGVRSDRAGVPVEHRDRAPCRLLRSTTTSPARSRPTCASATPTSRTRWSKPPTSRGGPGAWRRAGRRPESFASSAYASRDTGFDSDFGSVTLVPPGSPPGTPPVTRLYENNRLTYAADLGALYSATAKIDVAAGAHYTRAELVSAATDALGVPRGKHRPHSGCSTSAPTTPSCATGRPRAGWRASCATSPAATTTRTARPSSAATCGSRGDDRNLPAALFLGAPAQGRLAFSRSRTCFAIA